MGSTGRFVLLLAAGVAIMVLYVRSGESLVVLGLSLVTLLAGLAVWAAQPWRIDGEAEAGPAGTDRGADDPGWEDTWRCGHDVTWDERGIVAVAVGDRLPHRTVWSRIDGIGIDEHRDRVDDRGPERRRGVRLDLYRPEVERSGGPWPDERPTRSEVWLCLGPDQDGDRVVDELTSAWRQIAARRWYPEPER